LTVPDTLKVVNMIPNSWSDEQNQDSEPNLSVNPANPAEIIGTAFTYDNPAGTSAVSPAMATNWAPIFSSLDGGDTWALQFVLPSAVGDQLPTWDVTCRYSGAGGEVYSGLISTGSPNILINRAPDAATQQAMIATVRGDQPFLEAATAVVGGVSHDRLFVGYNANGNRSTVNVFPDARAAVPATTATTLDVRFPFDMPPTRTAIHGSGVIYCAFYSYDGKVRSPADLRDVVIVKDLNWGTSARLSGPCSTLATGRRACGSRLGFPTRGTTQISRTRPLATIVTGRTSLSRLTPAMPTAYMSPTRPEPAQPMRRCTCAGPMTAARTGPAMSAPFPGPRTRASRSIRAALSASSTSRWLAPTG
jgi:hypothetical protein